MVAAEPGAHRDDQLCGAARGDTPKRTRSSAHIDRQYVDMGHQRHLPLRYRLDYRYHVVEIPTGSIRATIRDHVCLRYQPEPE